jgi:hypothetical protein
MTKKLEDMTADELYNKVREINKHRLHAVRYHETYQDYLEKQAKKYWDRYLQVKR